MYRKKALYVLMVLLTIFGCIFMVSLANFLRKSAILNIGVGYFWENTMIMFFSVMGIFRIIYEIWLIEHH